MPQDVSILDFTGLNKNGGNLAPFDFRINLQAALSEAYIAKGKVNVQKLRADIDKGVFGKYGQEFIKDADGSITRRSDGITTDKEIEAYVKNRTAFGSQGFDELAFKISHDFSDYLYNQKYCPDVQTMGRCMEPNSKDVDGYEYNSEDAPRKSNFVDAGIDEAAFNKAKAALIGK